MLKNKFFLTGVLAGVLFGIAISIWITTVSESISMVKILLEGSGVGLVFWAMQKLILRKSFVKIRGDMIAGAVVMVLLSGLVLFFGGNEKGAIFMVGAALSLLLNLCFHWFAEKMIWARLIVRVRRWYRGFRKVQGGLK